MLARLGFDVDLAPVVDRGLTRSLAALVLGERCASADPDEIVARRRDFLDGLHARAWAAASSTSRASAGRISTRTSLCRRCRTTARRALDLDALPRARGTREGGHDLACGRAGRLAGVARPGDVATDLLREDLRFTGGRLGRSRDGRARCVRRAPRTVRGGRARPDATSCSCAAGSSVSPSCVRRWRGRVPRGAQAEAAARVEAYARHLAALRHAAGPPGNHARGCPRRTGGPGARAAAGAAPRWAPPRLSRTGRRRRRPAPAGAGSGASATSRAGPARPCASSRRQASRRWTP